MQVAVLGASGYSGAELLRLLAGHPSAEVTAIGAGASAGALVASVYPHLMPFASRSFESLQPEEVGARADLAFLALPHAESASVAPAVVEAGARVVDLSGAFRLPAGEYPSWYGFEHPQPAWLGKAVYGLPELFAERIAGAELVANPGCYATAVVLALAPLLSAGLIGAEGIVVDAKSGTSGAGKAPTASTHFATTEGSVRPYKAGGVHQHTPEIELALDVSLTFVPHLVPATRGILATCYARTAVSAEGLLATLRDAYAASPFVQVLPEGTLPDSKRVTGANAVELGAAVDARTGTAIVVAALDNLMKGAAGQAVQNMNLMLGLPETAGLEALAVYP